jgi:hypothetical protein
VAKLLQKKNTTYNEFHIKIDPFNDVHLNVSVTIVLMVMLMLVLVRMLIFRTLVKRSTVHNNGDGDVNVRNDVKRSRKCLVL